MTDIYDPGTPRKTPAEVPEPDKDPEVVPERPDAEPATPAWEPEVRPEREPEVRPDQSPELRPKREQKKISFLMLKIVVATDFSDNAGHAVSFAAGVAAKCKATLYLLHAMDGATDPVLEPVALDTKWQQKYTREKFELLQGAKLRLLQRNPRLTVELRLDRGMAADSIMGFAEKERADLIVMGARGSSAFKEKLLGSVTADIVAHSAIPVVAVPPGYRYHELRAFLLAIRQFKEDKTAVNALIGMAQVFGARMHIGSFVSDDAGHVAESIDSARHLEHYTGYLRKEYPTIDFTEYRLDGPDLQASIDRYCQEQNIDMLAVFNHPRSIIDKLCRRNNTQRALFHSQVPVMVLPGG